MNSPSTDERPNSFHLGPPEDAFTEFVSYAQSILCNGSHVQDGKQTDYQQVEEFQGPPWAWVCSHILATCKAYSSGVTAAILLSELSQAWQEHYRAKNSKPKLTHKIDSHFGRKQNRRRLPNTVIIDSIHDKKFFPLDAVLEAIVEDVFILPGTSSYLLRLKDPWSSNTIEHYLHQKFYDLVRPDHGILRKGRELRLCGCRLRIVPGSGQLRLLPTEYLVILLDEENDDDCMLLGAQFCSDSFSLIASNAFETSSEYCFYARVERIGNMEVQAERKVHEQFHRSRHQKILLADTFGNTAELVLWDDQILLSYLFSQCSWLALDKPCIIDNSYSGNESSKGICLAYGTKTRIYCVPYVVQEEQVTVVPSQSFTQLSRPTSVSKVPSLDEGSQVIGISQILLPCDPQGSLDFNNFPFRLFTVDLRDKMTNVAVYGMVSFLACVHHNSKIFLMGIEDSTGSVNIKLYFNKAWSAGNMERGHVVFLSGLACYETSGGRLECLWYENSSDAHLFNISSLLALLNSPCLYHTSLLSDLPKGQNNTQVCKVSIENVELHHLSIELSHTHCGYLVTAANSGSFVCSFCQRDCDAEVTSNFRFIVVLRDNSSKVRACCSGQSAAELLQVLPDEFCSWPEDEQAMYLFTIQNEVFMVSICKYFSNDDGTKPHNINSNSNMPAWSIVRALKCD